MASRNNELSDERGSVRVYGISHDDNNNNSIPDVCEAVNGNGGGNGGGGQPGGGSGGNTDDPNDDAKAKSEAWIKVVNSRLKTALAGSNLLLKRLIPQERLQKIRELKGEQIYKKRLKLRNSIARARLIFKEEIEAIFKEQPKTITSSAYSLDGALRAAVQEYNRGIATARWKKARPIVKEALRQFGVVLGRS